MAPFIRLLSQKLAIKGYRRKDKANGSDEVPDTVLRNALGVEKSGESNQRAASGHGIDRATRSSGKGETDRSDRSEEFISAQ